MSEYLKLLRFYFLLLALFTIGRWALGFAGVEYDKGHHVFSIVILSLIASAHHAAFARAFRGWGLRQALVLGALVGLSSQVVIWLSTALSYGTGLETFFNAPRALNVEQPVGFAQAMVGRSITLVANTVTNAIAGLIGWAMGAVLPRTASA